MLRKTQAPRRRVFVRNGNWRTLVADVVRAKGVEEIEDGFFAEPESDGALGWQAATVGPGDDVFAVFVVGAMDGQRDLAGGPAVLGRADEGFLLLLKGLERLVG